MQYDSLVSLIKAKKTYLCVGLDTDPRKIPRSLLKEKDPVFAFNRQIIDATGDYCIAYKPNIAFYEAQGPKGWESLQKTCEYISRDFFTIADAKRGDIGNSSDLYARTFFEPEAAGLNFDAVTVSPYMGYDSIEPFLKFKEKWTIILALTSNPGHRDFQIFENSEGKLYEAVVRQSEEWASFENLMFVVGATDVTALRKLRNMAPKHFFLVPGIGAQGGDLEEVSKIGLTESGGLLVNVSRSILYADDTASFANAAGNEAKALQRQMEVLLDKYAWHSPIP